MSIKTEKLKLLISIAKETSTPHSVTTVDNCVPLTKSQVHDLCDSVLIRKI